MEQLLCRLAAWGRLQRKGLSSEKLTRLRQPSRRASLAAPKKWPRMLTYFYRHFNLETHKTPADGFGKCKRSMGGDSNHIQLRPAPATINLGIHRRWGPPKNQRKMKDSLSIATIVANPGIVSEIAERKVKTSRKGLIESLLMKLQTQTRPRENLLGF